MTAYFEHYARVNDLSPTGRKCTWRYYDALFSSSLPDERHSRILDFGCGAGVFVEWLVRDKKYTNVVGIDRDDGQVSFATKLGLPVLLVKDGARWLIEQQSFDLIVVNDVLEHIPAPAHTTLLDTLRSKLSCSGLIVFRVPNANSAFAARYRYIDSTHARSYTETSLAHELSCAGFTNIQISAEPWLPSLTARGALRMLGLCVTRGWRRLEAVAELGSPGLSIPLSLNLIATCRSSIVQ